MSLQGTRLPTESLRHTLYKLDPDLQKAHQKFAFATVWDDHEVANDYSGLAPEWDVPSPEFTAGRAAAYKAWYEHMPIRSITTREPGELRIYRRLKYGKLAEFTMLDDRQYRTDNPCGDGEAYRCDEALNSDYTVLGRRLDLRFVTSVEDPNGTGYKEASWVVGSRVQNRLDLKSRR